MLTPYDDLPFHQIPCSFDYAGTSDFRFFDRYYFSVCDPAGRLFLTTGIGVYKNMNVLDGYGTLVVEDKKKHKQCSVRVSRTLRPIFEIGAGPLHYEILEGLKRFRLFMDENEHGLSFDLLWTGEFPPQEEVQHFGRVYGVVRQDYTRFFQNGTVTGHITIDGRTFDTGESGWWSTRDRSWGVRPGVGGAGPQSQVPNKMKSAIEEMQTCYAGADVPQFGFFFGSLFGTPDLEGFLIYMEDNEGKALGLDGGIMLPYGQGDGKPIAFVGLEHDLEMFPGTLAMHRGKFVLHAENGDKLNLDVERLVPPIVNPGSGYMDGFHDQAGLGAYRGDFVIESDRYDVSHPEKIIDEGGYREFPLDTTREGGLRITLNGTGGFGDCVYAVSESHHRYKR